MIIAGPIGRPFDRPALVPLSQRQGAKNLLTNGAFKGAIGSSIPGWTASTPTGAIAPTYSGGKVIIDRSPAGSPSIGQTLVDGPLIGSKRYRATMVADKAGMIVLLRAGQNLSSIIVTLTSASPSVEFTNNSSAAIWVHDGDPTGGEADRIELISLLLEEV